METHFFGVCSPGRSRMISNWCWKSVCGVGAGGHHMLPVQLDGTEQIQLGQDRSGHAGPEDGRRNLGPAVRVICCQEDESLGQAKLPALLIVGIHMIMVTQPGAHHNQDLQARNANP